MGQAVLLAVQVDAEGLLEGEGVLAEVPLGSSSITLKACVLEGLLS
jgi:hypothetical protein